MPPPISAVMCGGGSSTCDEQQPRRRSRLRRFEFYRLQSIISSGIMTSQVTSRVESLP